MYEELVKRLRYDNMNIYQMIDILDEAADAIEQMSHDIDAMNDSIIALYNALPKWISVTKRLPEMERKSYWVCTNTGYQCECRWTNNIFGIKESDEWGWSIFDVPQYQKVIAWMDLPEPYKPKEET